MKNRDLKKGKESTIGKIIYGFLLFMPLIAILSSIIINTFNMSAKQETEITYKYETNEVNSGDDLVIGNIYHFNFDDYITEISTNNTFELDINLVEGLIEFVDFSIDDYITEDYVLQNIRFTFDDTWNYRVYLFSSTYIYGTFEEQSTLFSNCDVIINNFLNIDFQYFSKCENIPIESVETHNLDTQDIFYKAIEKVEQSNLFNWAENSLIYTGIHNTCTQLSITTTFIPLLLAYWLIISVIYILYDIILMVLIILHNKIHQLQDSLS